MNKYKEIITITKLKEAFRATDDVEEWKLILEAVNEKILAEARFYRNNEFNPYKTELNGFYWFLKDQIAKNSPCSLTGKTVDL